MKAIHDPAGALGAGLAAIRLQYQVPEGFPAEVLAAAAESARRAPSAHRDRTSEQFVTLDPASSTDLDQAFAIEAAGTDLILHYAIADVAWFVDDGGVIDAEAWRRGTTLYLPDGKAGLVSAGAERRGGELAARRAAPGGGVQRADRRRGQGEPRRRRARDDPQPRQAWHMTR